MAGEHAMTNGIVIGAVKAVANPTPAPMIPDAMWFSFAKIIARFAPKTVQIIIRRL